VKRIKIKKYKKDQKFLGRIGGTSADHGKN